MEVSGFIVRISKRVSCCCSIKSSSKILNITYQSMSLNSSCIYLNNSVKIHRHITTTHVLSTTLVM